MSLLVGKGTFSSWSQTGSFQCNYTWTDSSQIQVLVFKPLLTAAGPALTDSQAVGSLLCICLTQSLQLWQERLSGSERSLLMDYSQGTEPDCDDLFPDVELSPQFGGLDSFLLKDPNTLNLHTVDRKALYCNCATIKKK